MVTERGSQYLERLQAAEKSQRLYDDRKAARRAANPAGKSAASPKKPTAGKIDYSPCAVMERDSQFFAEDAVHLQALRRREAQMVYANRGAVLTPRQSKPFYNPTATQVAMNNEWPLRSVDAFGTTFVRELEGSVNAEAFDGSRVSNRNPWAVTTRQGGLHHSARVEVGTPLGFSVCGRR